MVFTRSLISKSSRPVTNPLVIASRAPITIIINVTFMSHSFLQYPRGMLVLVFLFAFLQFYFVVSRYSWIHNSENSFFFFFFFLTIVWSRYGDLCVYTFWWSLLKEYTLNQSDPEGWYLLGSHQCFKIIYIR